MKEPKTERLGECRQCGRGIYWERDRGSYFLQAAQVVCKYCARDASVAWAAAILRRAAQERKQAADAKRRAAHLRRQKKANAKLREVA